MAPRRRGLIADGGPAADAAAERPSKSSRKRASHALQDLGVELVGVPDEVLERMPLSEELRDAIRTAREIRSHEGRRRQLQLVGKLMRQADGDAIRTALVEQTADHRKATAIQHAAERWREQILQDDRVLAQWARQFPQTTESVRPLIAQARAELADNAPGRSFRMLFRLLREALMRSAEAAAVDGQTQRTPEVKP